MAAIAPASAADLLELIRRSGILTADRVQALPAVGNLPVEAHQAAQRLVEGGYITRFQASQLLLGRYKGFRIGQYVIQELLGRGGMGAVYRAKHLELNRPVAIKVLAPSRGEDPKLATERFLREARAAAALDHPNIVRIFDVARHHQTPYLVMEYVDGETLQQVLDRDGAMTIEDAAECIAQAAAGLQHAHEMGFVHRDIKPANLIRDRNGLVKILDMGLARTANAQDRLTEHFDEGAVVGTADYIAPEQAINCPDIDHRADIYSLGATLFTLISGRPPFEGNTTQKLMQHQMKAPPLLHTLVPSVPVPLSKIVARMLEKKPSQRFRDAGEVIAALAPWAGGSARVLAGIARTSLSQSPDIHASLAELSFPGSSNSAVRLPPSGDGGSSCDVIAVNISEALQSTHVSSSAETTRTPAATAPTTVAEPMIRPPMGPSRRLLRVDSSALWLVSVGLGVGFLLGLLGGWWFFGR
ncbi:MAG: serine/threonine-protein kinase [Gemmataceae bacterium]|nr:serine/threonine protein kinase [Gemmata sp.]MDW8196796.1 serine/threonine-protein kinase [Gemmataceae bacterium]